MSHDEASVRRLLARLGDPRKLGACHKAGPTRFDPGRARACPGAATAYAHTEPGSYKRAIPREDQFNNAIRRKPEPRNSSQNPFSCKSL
jgi:hypothetical protein